MISVKTPKEISVMREGGKRLAEVMASLISLVKPGVATKELDMASQTLILAAGGELAFKGYDGFPGAICTSVNEEVVHAVPSSRLLKEGDIVTLDIGLVWPASAKATAGKQGWFLDMARTVPVGGIDKDAMRLCEVTQQSLEVGIKEARAGARVGDIGNAVQQFVEKNGYNVVRELCGHGIGRDLHEDPKVLNYGARNTGMALKEGMVICIEPMVTAGDWKLKRSKDGHGFETKDGSLSCHFEDTIAITSSGAQVLTQNG
ncbi:MAG: type I methionyl aminopeptidase [Candidatus Wildermuthbacteria bacterium]|nr:type I methionyl aminopeptidase [Candidatus Wildermuthbacteria bacterium]